MSDAPRSATVTFLWRLAISLLITSCVTVGVVLGVNRGIDDRVAKIERVDLVLAPAPPQGENVLIIGSDTRAFVSDEGEKNSFGDPTVESGQRSDTLMVAHIEPGSQRTVVVSFPRDLMVQVPGAGNGEQMINSAYSSGGPQRVIETLNANFGIPINHYMEVDFESFQAIVDAIGNVNVYVPGELLDDSPDGGTAFHSIYGAGCYSMNGAVALAYVRSRHMLKPDPEGTIVIDDKTWSRADSNSDLDRIKRQQDFVRQLGAVAVGRSLNNPFTAVELADNVLGYLKVDSEFSRDDANALIRAFRTVDVNDPNAIKFLTIPTTAYEPNPNRLAVAPDAESVLSQLRDFGNDTPKPPRVAPSQVKVVVRDGTATPIAQGVARALQTEGFRASSPTPSTTTSSSRAPSRLAISEIRYGANQADAAKTVLDYIPDARLVLDRKLDDAGHLVLVLGSSFAAVTVPSTTTTTTVPGAPITTGPVTTTVPPTSTTTTLPPDFCPN